MQNIEMSRRSILAGSCGVGIASILPSSKSLAAESARQPFFDEPIKMELDPEEQSWLQGEQGPTRQKIMQTLVTYGEIHGAKKFVPLNGPIHSVSSFALLYLDEMEAVIEELVEAGLKAKVPFTVNPRPTDYDRVKINIAEKAAFRVMFPKQRKLEEGLAKLGLKSEKSFSCTSYQPEVGVIPSRNDVICWSESSAVSYANAWLGARSNRNSGLIDLFCAILGKTPQFGIRHRQRY